MLKKNGQQVTIASGGFIVTNKAKILRESYFLITIKFLSTLDNKIKNFDIPDTIPIGHHRNYQVGAFRGYLQVTNIGNGKFSVFLVPG